MGVAGGGVATSRLSGVGAVVVGGGGGVVVTTGGGVSRGGGTGFSTVDGGCGRVSVGMCSVCDSATAGGFFSPFSVGSGATGGALCALACASMIFWSCVMCRSTSPLFGALGSSRRYFW